MPPSEIDMEMNGTLIADLTTTVRKAEGFCQFEGGDIDCRNEPSTFCSNEECGIEICASHAKAFGGKLYCPNCVRTVRAEMLPILHEEKKLHPVFQEIVNRWIPPLKD